MHANNSHITNQGGSVQVSYMFVTASVQRGGEVGTKVPLLTKNLFAADTWERKKIGFLQQE